MTNTPDTSPEAVERLAQMLEKDARDQHTQPCEMTGLMPGDECEIAATLRDLSAALEIEKLNCVTLLNDADLDYNRKTNGLIRRHAKQILDLKARAEAAEAERDEALNQLDSSRHSVDVLESRVAKLKAELAEAVGVIVECREEIDDYIRHEYPHDHPVQERYRERDFAANPARAFLARHQKEKDT